MLGEFLKNQGEFMNQKDINQQIEEEITKGIPSIQTRTNLFDQIKLRRNDTHVIDDHNKELPEIDVNSASNSNESIEEILPEQVSRTSLFDQINARRDDSHVIGTPNISHLGLSPILEKIKTAFTPKSDNLPLENLDKGKTIDNKPSFSNLLDDTNALFDDLDDNIPIDTNIPTNIVNNNNISDNIDTTVIETNTVDNTIVDNNTINNSKLDSNYVKNI
jgi:hypothetical protein